MISWPGQVFLVLSTGIGETGRDGAKDRHNTLQMPTVSTALQQQQLLSLPTRQSIPVLHYPYCWEGVFLMSNVNFPWCNLSPLLLVELMHMEYSLLLSSMQQLFMCLKTVVMTSLSLLFSKLNNLSNMYKA